MLHDQQNAVAGEWMARWLPLAWFSVAVGSTLSVLVLQAMTPTDGPAITFANLYRWVLGWLCFTAMLALGTIAGILRIDLLKAKHFHSPNVQDVTLALLGALIGVILVILLLNGSGWLWIGTSMTMAAVGLIPLLAIRLCKRP
jgi:hypothetical protein